MYHVNPTFGATLIVIMTIAGILFVGTIVIGAMKSLQRSHFPKWTFLDYISVGYARHLYLKYILRKK